MTQLRGDRPSYAAVMARVTELESTLAIRRKRELKALAVITRTALIKPKTDADRAVIRFARQVLQALNGKETS